MNAEQRENFRDAILRVLDERASDQWGLSVGALQIFLGSKGFRSSKVAEINAELLYLADKKLVAQIGKQISPENRCWRITADGRDYVAQNGNE